jgi:hypothetical protein
VERLRDAVAAPGAINYVSALLEAAPAATATH